MSNVNRRQGLVRWTQPIWFDGLLLAVALEDPRMRIETPPMVEGEGRTESPDFITRLRLEDNWYEFPGAYVLRQLGYQSVGKPEPVLTETAWNLDSESLAHRC